MRNGTQADINACNGDATKLPFDVVFKYDGYKLTRCSDFDDDSDSVYFANEDYSSFLSIDELKPIDPEPVFFDLEKALADGKCWTRDGQEVSQLVRFKEVTEKFSLRGVISGQIEAFQDTGDWSAGWTKGNGRDLTTIPPVPKTRTVTFVQYQYPDGRFVYVQEGYAMVSEWKATGKIFTEEVTL